MHNRYTHYSKKSREKYAQLEKKMIFFMASSVLRENLTSDK